MSGFGMENDRQRDRQAGFVEHLAKPVDFAVLNQAVTRLRRQGYYCFLIMRGRLIFGILGKNFQSETSSAVYVYGIGDWLCLEHHFPQLLVRVARYRFASPKRQRRGFPYKPWGNAHGTTHAHEPALKARFIQKPLRLFHDNPGQRVRRQLNAPAQFDPSGNDTAATLSQADMLEGLKKKVLEMDQRPRPRTIAAFTGSAATARFR